MIINGKEMNIGDGLTIAQLLEKLTLSKDKVVVEVNYEIVEKYAYDQRILSNGDRVEIVSFIGGG